LAAFLPKEAARKTGTTCFPKLARAEEEGDSFCRMEEGKTLCGQKKALG